MKDKVLYLHINPITLEIFYVGIGNSKRPYRVSKRSKFWNNIVNKYGNPIIEILNDLSWEEACELEKHYIKIIGRRDLGLGPLVNMTDGGDGTIGQYHSEETRIKKSIWQLGKKKKPMSQETKDKLSLAFKGKKKKIV